MNKLNEPLEELFDSSRLMILNFDEIPDDIDREDDIRVFFEECQAKGLDPKKPENRQVFNNRLLAKYKVRYLVSRYAEDRISMIRGSQIAKEGRTLHLGIDIFCKDLEVVYAPSDGQILQIGQEPEDHSFGYYSILKPDDSKLPYISFGHLGPDIHELGKVKAGDVIGKLGDHSQNGGWSRHLHLQLLKDLPTNGDAPIGYSSKANLDINQVKFPDPSNYFPNWEFQT